MSDAERVLSLLGNASVTQADMAFVLDLTIRQVQSACEELRRTGLRMRTAEDAAARLTLWEVAS